MAGEPLPARAAPASADRRARPGSSADTVRADQVEHLRRTETIMVRVRVLAAAFAVLQTLAYRPPEGLALPDHVVPAGLALAVVLLVLAAASWASVGRIRTIRQARGLAVSTLVADAAVALAFVVLWAFDGESALWAILFVVPLEGAMKHQLPGALGTWAAMTGGYWLKDIWAAQTYGHDLAWESISFRMGVNLLIALVAGSMARDLLARRSEAVASLEELSRVDVMRQHLVSTLAHDVRSPLATVRSALSLLSEHDDMPPEQRTVLLAAAARQAGRLQYLAEDLLDLARLEGGQLSLEVAPVELPDAVTEALRYADGEKAFATDVPADLFVLADRRRLEQVLVNLVGNSLRYGAAPHRIAAQRRDDHVTVEVVDHGAGVPPERQDRLFQPFAAGESKGSVGLGLWICRMLLEAQSGSLTYGHSDGASCFTVRLPLAASATGEKPSSTTEATAR